MTLQVNALFRPRRRERGVGQRSHDRRRFPRARAGARPIHDVEVDSGYTGSDQTRQEMLQNAHFVDAKVELFAKYRVDAVEASLGRSTRLRVSCWKRA